MRERADAADVRVPDRGPVTQPAVPVPAAPPAHAALTLQATAGNAATARLLGGGPPLARTTATPPPLPPAPVPEPPARSAWGAVSAQLQTLLAGTPSPMVAALDAPPGFAGGLPAQARRLAGAWEGLDAGEPVPPAARAVFEHSYGRDLAGARMHAGTPAAREVTGTLGVQGLTVGNHMIFPGTPPAAVLGHELAHVVQQSDRGAAPAHGRLRAAPPGSAVETDAGRAAAAALAGTPYRVGPAGGEDLAMLAPLAWLAIAALVAGVGIGVAAEVAGPSYEQNQQAAEQRHADDSIGAWAHAAWLWVPVGGTATRIWEAQSGAERVFNIVLMPIDVLTLGALGSSLGKIANRALWQTALRQASEQELAQLAAQGVRAVGQAEVQTAARAALESGQAIIATVGRRNHAIVFVKVGERYYRLSGGILRSMRVAEMGAFNPTSINAFYAFGGATESAAILAEAQQLSRGVGLGFSFRSCGLSAANLAQAGGLRLGLSGGRAFFPVTVMGTLAEQGGVTMSQLGAQRMIGGTAFNYALLGSVRGGATIVSNPDDFASSLVHMLTPPPVVAGPHAAATTGTGGPDAGMDAATEVTLAEVYAALDAGSGQDMALAEAPLSYLDLLGRVQPAGAGAGTGPVSVTPLYSFVAAASDELVSRAPAPGQCVDLSDRAPAPAPSDPRRVLDLAGRPQYRDGARRLAADLRLPGPVFGPIVLDRAHDYFPFTFDGPEARDAALAALEQAGVAGADLDRAAASLR